MSQVGRVGGSTGGLLSALDKMILKALSNFEAVINNFTKGIIKKGKITINGKDMDATSPSGMFGLKAVLNKIEMLTLLMIGAAKAQQKIAKNISEQLQQNK